ncbi:hypothetical protein QZH41_006590 [Actinostola sp. cb2023]|nr:hypothetical protein QZH41_006590 [Actinostola sp. cb2023]
MPSIPTQPNDEVSDDTDSSDDDESDDDELPTFSVRAQQGIDVYGQEQQDGFEAQPDTEMPPAANTDVEDNAADTNNTEGIVTTEEPAAPDHEEDELHSRPHRNRQAPQRFTYINPGTPVYLNPIMTHQEKAGVCPTLASPFGACIITCGADEDCEGNTKCCNNGCGAWCSAPIETMCPRMRAASNKHMFGQYIPECEVSGAFKTVQCHEGSCFCVDNRGVPDMSTKIRGAVPKCPEKTLCQQQVEQANKLPPIGRFVPQCKPDGSFKERQCYASTGQCWCVDTYGREWFGTRSRGNAALDCTKSGLTPCQLRRQQAVGLLGAFRPRCDSQGNYEYVQQHEGYYWCVDSKGREINGTRKRFSKPTCHNRGLSCVRLLVGRYIPQCENDGSFKQVQCHPSTGYCWCVNKTTGVIVPDTQIRGRPSCNRACPYGQPLVMCLVNPCKMTSCPVNPKAICRPSYCGGCKAEFFDHDNKKVDCTKVPCLYGLLLVLVTRWQRMAWDESTRSAKMPKEDINNVHVNLTFNNDFEMINDSLPDFIKALKTQLSQRLDMKQEQITDLSVTRGSIVVQFNVVPVDGGRDIENFAQYVQDEVRRNGIVITYGGMSFVASPQLVKASANYQSHENPAKQGGLTSTHIALICVFAALAIAIAAVIVIVQLPITTTTYSNYITTTTYSNYITTTTYSNYITTTTYSNYITTTTYSNYITTTTYSNYITTTTYSKTTSPPLPIATTSPPLPTYSNYITTTTYSNYITTTTYSNYITTTTYSNYITTTTYSNYITTTTYSNYITTTTYSNYITTTTYSNYITTTTYSNYITTTTTIATTSPPLPIATTSPPLPIATTSPPLPIATTSPPLPIATTSPPLPIATTSPPLPIATTSPPLPIATTSPPLPIATTSPPLPIATTHHHYL